MWLLVIAYPDISKDAFEFIQKHRKQNDDRYSIVAPHFTFIFPVSDISRSEFIQEVQLLARDTHKIEFHIGKAILNKDAFSEKYHEFLVPDKGYQEIITLHDLLYSGKLSPHLKKEIGYIPHITVGNSADQNESMLRVTELNSSDLNISGTIGQLTIARYDGGKVEDLEHVSLK